MWRWLRALLACRVYCSLASTFSWLLFKISLPWDILCLTILKSGHLVFNNSTHCLVLNLRIRRDVSSCLIQPHLYTLFSIEITLPARNHASSLVGSPSWHQGENHSVPPFSLEGKAIAQKLLLYSIRRLILILAIKLSTWLKRNWCLSFRHVDLLTKLWISVL